MQRRRKCPADTAIQDTKVGPPSHRTLISLTEILITWYYLTQITGLRQTYDVMTSLTDIPSITSLIS